MPENNPKISIVLPVYNGSKYLRSAIDSCLRQTYQDFELIIVDDCSTDATPEIIKSYADPRIRSIRNRTNLRLPNSLNVGFKEARGNYLTWTSDDNQYLPTALEEMFNFLQEHPNVDFVYTDMYVLNLETGEKTLKLCSHWTFYFENIIGACYLYTRKVYETIGGYNPQFEWVEDYDYWLRVEKRFSMRRLARPLYLYGNHPQSLTNLRLYSIDILTYLLRFRYGYLTFDGLAEALGGYVLKFLPFKKESRKVWSYSLKKVSRMELGLQLIFWNSIIFSIVKKTITAIRIGFKRFIKLFKKDQGFQELLSAAKLGTNEKVQVLCVIPFLTMGGSEKVMQDVVRGLTPHGYDFHLFCFKKENNPWIREFLKHFLNLIGIPPVYDVDVYSAYMIQIIRKLNIKMILFTNEHMTYKSLEKIKNIFPDIKTVDIVHLEHVGGTHKHVSQTGAPSIDRRICISYHLLEYLKREYENWGLPGPLAERLRAIHNGTNLMEFSRKNVKGGSFRKHYQIPEGVRIISFIARMAKEKNPFLFLDIARAVLAKESGFPVRFIMAGDGPLLESVRSKVRDYGLEDNIILPGAVTNVAELLADSFLFVIVSTHEGIPLSIQEAMMMQVPVISTKVGAIHEIVKDGLNGYLVSLDEKIIDQVTDRIYSLLDDEQKYRAMAQAAREEACPEFTLETMSHRYREIFEEVLNG